MCERIRAVLLKERGTFAGERHAVAKCLEALLHFLSSARGGANALG